MRAESIHVLLVSSGLCTAVADIVVSYADFAFKLVREMQYDSRVRIVGELDDGRLVFKATESRWFTTDGSQETIYNETTDNIVANGKYVAIGSSAQICVRDMVANTVQSMRLRCCELAIKNGRLLCAETNSKRIKLFDLKSCKLLRSWVCRESAALELSNTHVAVLTDANLQLWNLKSGMRRTIWNGKVDATSFMGSVIACALQSEIKVFGANGRLLHTVQNKQRIYSMVALACGKLVVDSMNQTLNVWNVETGQLLAHEKTLIVRMFGLKDGQLATTKFGGHIFFYE